MSTLKIETKKGTRLISNHDDEMKKIVTFFWIKGINKEKTLDGGVISHKHNKLLTERYIFEFLLKNSIYMVLVVYMYRGTSDRK